jgi:ribosomal RNA-processing protein 1
MLKNVNSDFPFPSIGFWMSDKPRVQHHLAEELASLSLNFPAKLCYFTAMWKTMKLEWSGVDRYRLNKFYYLFRQFHRAAFQMLKERTWNEENIEKLNQQVYLNKDTGLFGWVSKD